MLHGTDALAPTFATTVLPAREGESLAAAAARGARRARGDRLWFSLASTEPAGSDLLARLALGRDAREELWRGLRLDRFATKGAA